MKGENNHELIRFTGIGEHRVLKVEVFNSVSEIIRYVRDGIAKGVSESPVYLNDGIIDFEEYEHYRSEKIIDNDTEIMEFIEAGWDRIDNSWSGSHKSVLLNNFGSKENVVNFCFDFIKNEIDFINRNYPTSLEENELSRKKLGEVRMNSIKEKINSSKERREDRKRVRDLIDSDDIEGFAQLKGQEILEWRIEGNHYKSNFPWQDVRSHYGLTASQLKRFRKSKGYHSVLTQKCEEKVQEYRQKRNLNIPGSGDSWVPEEWFNARIIRLAGAIGFIEPYYI